MRVGDIRLYKEEGLYYKVKIIDVREYEEMNVSNDSFEIRTFVDYEYLSRYEKGKMNSESVEVFKSRSQALDRNPNCWHCKQQLSEQSDELCPLCGWIVCPNDEACECNYKKQSLLRPQITQVFY